MTDDASDSLLPFAGAGGLALVGGLAGLLLAVFLFAYRRFQRHGAGT
jgi:prolipoprotein diacylglyceryltransferase